MCTSITLTSTEGRVFYGRTMDLNLGMFGEDPGTDATSIVNIPQGVRIDSQLEPWTAKYAAIGVGGRDSFYLYDGVNEHGLAGDVQVLMEATHATADSLKDRNLKGLLGEEFVTFVLTNFKSVADIKEHIGEYALLDQPSVSGDQSMELPLHYTFFDETKAGVVLEPTDNGAFKLYDSIGVMTNSPEYDWHLTNIRNYISLDNLDPKKPKSVSANLTLQPIEAGTGYGMFGLPGDYTAPSRFVRATMLANHLDPFSADQGLNQLYGVFRSVMVPRGLEKEAADNPLSDCTRYWAGYDLTQRRLCVQSCRGLAFTAQTLKAQGETITFTPIDVSDHLHSLD